MFRNIYFQFMNYNNIKNIKITTRRNIFIRRIFPYEVWPPEVKFIIYFRKNVFCEKDC